MARAIDADTLDFSNCRIEIIGDTRFLSLRDVANVIKTAPTLTPPEIVYCQDCENHWDFIGKHICVKLNCNCPDDSEFFCKFGRKKDGSTTD